MKCKHEDCNDDIYDFDYCIDHIAIYHSEFKPRRCQHENCEKESLIEQDYCWEHIGFYFTQFQRTTDPDNEDRAIIEKINRRQYGKISI